MSVRHGTRARGRSTAWLLGPCLLVLALFLMHGSPVGAAEGCHGSVSALAPMPAGHDASRAALAHTATAHTATMEHPGHAARAIGSAGMPGPLCVSTPAHEQVSLPSPGLTAVAAVTMPTAWALARLRAGGTRRRGPPAGGREHLLRACIART